MRKEPNGMDLNLMGYLFQSAASSCDSLLRFADFLQSRQLCPVIVVAVVLRQLS